MPKKCDYCGEEMRDFTADRTLKRELNGRVWDIHALCYERLKNPTMGPILSTVNMVLIALRYDERAVWDDLDLHGEDDEWLILVGGGAFVIAVNLDPPAGMPKYDLSEAVAIPSTREEPGDADYRVVLRSNSEREIAIKLAELLMKSKVDETLYVAGMAQHVAESKAIEVRAPWADWKGD